MAEDLSQAMILALFPVHLESLARTLVHLSFQAARIYAMLSSSLSLSRQLIQIQEFITSATTLGALLGGLGAGIMSDWTCRRLVLAVTDIVFMGGAIGQAV
jgi:hypothetical protein